MTSARRRSRWRHRGGDHSAGADRNTLRTRGRDEAADVTSGNGGSRHLGDDVDRVDHIHRYPGGWLTTIGPSGRHTLHDPNSHSHNETSRCYTARANHTADDIEGDPALGDSSIHAARDWTVCTCSYPAAGLWALREWACTGGRRISGRGGRVVRGEVGPRWVTIRLLAATPTPPR